MPLLKTHQLPTKNNHSYLKKHQPFKKKPPKKKEI
jgi:hypothetical protein